jgi:hypothetical protein
MTVGIIVNNVKVHFLASVNYKGVISEMALSCQSFLFVFFASVQSVFVKSWLTLSYILWKSADDHSNI